MSYEYKKEALKINEIYKIHFSLNEGRRILIAYQHLLRSLWVRVVSWLCISLYFHKRKLTRTHLLVIELKVNWSYSHLKRYIHICWQKYSRLKNDIVRCYKVYTSEQNHKRNNWIKHQNFYVTKLLNGNWTKLLIVFNSYL